MTSPFQRKPESPLPQGKGMTPNSLASASLQGDGQRPGRQARGAAGEGEVLWGSEASSSLAPYSVEPLRWPEGGVYKWQVLDAKGRVVESYRSKWEADGRCKELNHD